MASDETSTPKMLYWSDLRSLCASGGPCITITLPPYQYGARNDARGSSPSTNLKSAVQLAERVLLKQNLPDNGEALLAPLHELAMELEMATSARARIIFSSPGVFRQFYLPLPALLRTVVGTYFHVLPLLDQLSVDRQFYILGLNEEHLRLLYCNDGEAEEVPLPDELTMKAQAAGKLYPPDHTVRGASPAGESLRLRSGVIFGIGTEREMTHERLRETFRLVDRGLSKVLGKQGLLLSGVDYEVAIYRREAVYPYLMEGFLEGDLHDLSVREMARRASEFARIQARQKAERQLRLLEEMSTDRTTFDIHRILEAAGEGRVARLIVGLAEEAAFGDAKQEVESGSQEALLNAAAVLSIRHRAEIFALPAGTMGHSSPVAALIRY